MQAGLRKNAACWNWRELHFPGKQCARFSAPDDIVERFRPFPVGNDCVDALGGGQLGSLQFCAHSAGSAAGAGAAGQRINAVVNRVDLFDQLCIRIEPGITVVESVNIRQNDQSFGRQRTATTEESMSLSPNSLSSDSISV